MSWYDKSKTPEPVEQLLTGEGKSGIHKHTLRRAYKRTHNINGPRFILSRVCAFCEFKQAYDLVVDMPERKA